ncbi:glutamate-1-semialdehyde 2,1-aminomutase [Halanaerobium saccharolyticum]|uniref:Glutamate-1-semialdehyde 2,1-aminomutase n=1 Tax=Halanaerobium saccharolyticum TaxID=43595 RepID=A0A4R7Z5Z3_9FIRM|nr:glutamate-1-semialdehyde 2,1-aminomutase [Halanaerobium saccharolyticum]RAK10565.1 glutamate-1-semialdehyde 2,1-aminomutase [Halanaerobium saccharolyticum]TDW06678.1 glutamate-1-semialdehyde 2,1-aminomutase [Halanaerobium saccharolyticum]TDX62313.1 glutamate-1-semialdehyde 2,1-aminomutase [Halanaerobium saccharolyticum]
MGDHRKKSAKAFKKAKKVIPGGVNSPARAFSAVEMDPIFIEKGEGAYLYDIDGNQYLDYVNSWGPMILGYNPPQVVKKLTKQLKKGTSFGAPTEIETEIAELIVYFYPAVDKVRMVNSGTEATMSAIRLARGYTGRDKIIKLEGCYHGHGDSLLVEAGSGVATLGIKGSPGVTENTAKETIVVPYNDQQAVEKVFTEYASEIAGIILEPVTGNMGVIAPEPGYLDFLREITRKNGALLIFDEVMTGFRLARGGAQELYEIEPDISTFGKIIGGGMPVGAYAGREEIMDYVAPAGPVYQAGTLSGNPMAMQAGLATLKELKNKKIYAQLEAKAEKLEKGFKKNIEELEFPAYFNRVGSMFTLFFTEKKVENYQDVKNCDLDLFAAYFKEMIKQGIYLPPSQFESNFISTALSEADLDKTIEANYQVLKKLKAEL